MYTDFMILRKQTFKIFGIGFFFQAFVLKFYENWQYSRLSHSVSMPCTILQNFSFYCM